METRNDMEVTHFRLSYIAPLKVTMLGWDRLSVTVPRPGRYYALAWRSVGNVHFELPRLLLPHDYNSFHIVCNPPRTS
jgi:hypothetical protein